MRQEPPSLWRDVVNFLGNREITPQLLLPLLEMVAERHAYEDSFLSWIPKHVTETGHRAEVEGDLRHADIGYRLWRDKRSALTRWANASKDGPFTDQELDEWWFSGGRGQKLVVDETKRLKGFLRAARFDTDDSTYLQDDLDKDYMHGIFVHQLHKDLTWLRELDMFRCIAFKTWPANTQTRQRWSDEEFKFAAVYYEDQQPYLVYDEKGADGIDPFTLDCENTEQSLGFGLDGLAYCMYVVMRAAVIEFVDEIKEHSRFPHVRGSLRCVECGRFVGRRAAGYGQLYCNEICKKRAAKRRYRQRGHAEQFSSEGKVA